ncbi:MAG TPA: ATPase, T2SS/T4P/T4SS family, partial [Chthoniobacterales bacterium]|nr:ATPase, T2SS/T4P/T4SS family [Chthoniobacterales bacterium]
MTAAERWKTVVEFVRSNQVSDISVFQSNVTARLEGRVVHLSEEGALSRSEIQELIVELIKRHPAAGPEVSGSLGSADYTAAIDGVRFRVNLGRAQGELFASLRPLPAHAPDLLEIGISKRIAAFAVALTDGLVLVSGPTGSGKTTTIAGIIEAINVSRPAKVI